MCLSNQQVSEQTVKELWEQEKAGGSLPDPSHQQAGNNHTPAISILSASTLAHCLVQKKNITEQTRGS